MVDGFWSWLVRFYVRACSFGEGIFLCRFFFVVFFQVGLTRLERNDEAAHVPVGRLLPRPEVVVLVRPLIPADFISILT